MAALSPILRSAESGILLFWCPGCDEVHWIRVKREGTQSPHWEWDGNVNQPTFSPSILIKSGHYASHATVNDECWCTYNALEVAAGRPPSGFECGVCHSFVRGGQIEFLPDCTHKLAGKTVPLPAWSED